MGYKANRKALSLADEQAGETKLGTCLLVAARYKVPRIDTKEGRKKVKEIIAHCIRNN